MKRVFQIIIFAVLLLPIVLIVAAFFLPPRLQIVRSTVVKAAPGEIFPLLHELRRWPEWTAWTTNREPSLVYTPSGPASGAGAVQSWTAQSGRGSIKLTAADPATGIAYELNFNEGRFISTGRIVLQPLPGETNGTQVIWTNEGDLGRNPVGRYLGLIMEQKMGADLEEGLANLKARFEPRAAK